MTLNIRIHNSGYNNDQLVIDAIEWQRQTRGVTWAGGLGRYDGHRNFKQIRFWDEAPSIDTVVLGSSTVMTLGNDSFQNISGIYNLASNSQNLSVTLDQAKYILDNAPSIKVIIVPIDWALGFVFYDLALSPGFDMSALASRSALNKIGNETIDWSLIKDSISLSKVKNLMQTLTRAIVSDDPFGELYSIFISPEGNDYRCPDGSLARDFDLAYRGMCLGFYADGSSSMRNFGRIIAEDRQQFILEQVRNTEVSYVAHLRESRGLPNRSFLEALAKLRGQAVLKAREIIFILPPLMPGVELAILQREDVGPYLRALKDEIKKWQGQNELSIIDAGASEKYGCSYDEFLDAHHAYRSCYRKIFGPFSSSFTPSG